MPDWTYHPILRPVGIALHGDRTRVKTMRHLERIGGTATGAWMIRFMGHMLPAESLTVDKGGFSAASPVLLSGAIDPSGRAARAFGEMEIGAIEVASGQSFRRPRHAAIIDRFDPDRVTDIVHCSADEYEPAKASARTVFVDVSRVDTAPVGAAYWVEGEHATVLRTVRDLRRRFGPDVLIAAGGYVHEPRDAIDLRDAGADLFIIGEGLAAAGPGLPKRMNEVLVGSNGVTDRGPRRNWVAGSLYALGLLFACCVAIYIALTSVLHPCDEEFIGLDIEGLRSINALLPDFMAHDRLSYAGASASAAVFYLALSYFGIRRRQQWAYHAFVVAGIAGFATFLLYFGFGYFDAWNAGVVAALLPFFLAAVIRPPSFEPFTESVDLVNDRTWRASLWGQLCFVILALGLVIGGLTICVVGVTNVFVISDLDFLQTTSHHLEMQHEDLLPLIAHDRASFGGALVANGLALLLMALWGIKRGQGWVWLTIAIAGTINLGFTLYAHFSTGYDELGHLLPVFLAAGFFVVGLLLTGPFLLRRRSTGRNERFAP